MSSDKKTLSSLLFLPLTAASISLIAGLCYGGSPLQGKPPTTRTSNDPPLPAKGKLGQDVFIAVMHGDLAGLKSLLKRGADPDARNGLQFTPLYLASATGQTEAMRTLLASGAKAEASSPYGTPLTFAAMGGNAAAARMLLGRGVNVNVARADGLTPLALAARVGATEIVGELLGKKANVHAKVNDGGTPLIIAAREGHLETVNALLRSGAMTDAKDVRGWTALMYASVNGHEKVVRTLLEKGANPNARETSGRTPLLLVASYGDHPEVIQTLIQGGADPSVTDPHKRTAQEVALARGRNANAEAFGGTVRAETTALRTPRQAVQVSLKLLQGSMTLFNKRTGCISCHHEGLGRMATAVAMERGFAISPELQKAQSGRCQGAINATAPLHNAALKSQEAMKQVPLYEMDEVATGYSFLLAGMAYQKEPPTAGAGAMALVLARLQTPQGNWRFTLPREPMQSSFFAYTALAVKSLLAYAPKSHKAEIAGRVGRAKRWLLSTPVKTSEDRAFRLLGALWAGATAEERQKAAQDLLESQRSDGGWAQQEGMQSDAYATGQALYALCVAGGLSPNDAAYEKGAQFLLRMQDEDGSWFVNKRAMPNNNYFHAGFPHGTSQYASFNGTCWATMALLQTLETPTKAALLERR